MSDNTPLVERLRAYVNPLMREAAARIEELEAELETQKIRTRVAIGAECQECGNIIYAAHEQIMSRSAYKPTLSVGERFEGNTTHLTKDARAALHARIADLEAEVDRLKNVDNSRNVEAREITSEFVRLQTARIAELEAENARLKARDTLGPYKLIHPDHLAGLDARIAELEAERNGLKAALAQIAECKGTTLRGPFASGDAGRWHEVGASKAFDQCAALARAALSEPSGETA